MGNTYEKTYYKETITLRDSKTYTLFKLITTVEEDGVVLINQSSIPEVEATPGSWWQDTDNSILYMHFSDSGDGTNKTIVTKFVLRFSNENKIYGNNFYEGKIDNISPISNKTSYVLWGTSEIEGGNLDLNNANGFFDVIFEKFIWEKSSITVKYGSDTMSYGEFATVFVGKLESKKWSENSFGLDFFSNKIDLEKRIPFDLYNITTYPNIATKSIGKPIPIVYGDYSIVLEDAPLCVCIHKNFLNTGQQATADAGSDTNTLVDSELNAISLKSNYFKGWTVNVGTTEYKISKSDYNITNAGTTTCSMETISGFTTGSVYTINNWYQQKWKIAGHAITSISQIYVNYQDGLGWQKIDLVSSDTPTATFVIQTNVDGSSGVFDENATLVKALFVGKNADGNASDIVSDLCQTYGELSAGDLDATSFTNSQTDTELVIRRYIDKQVTVRSVIDRISLSVFAYFYTGLNGKIYFVVWTTTRETGYDEYQDYEYFNFNVTDIGTDLRNKIAIGYSQNPQTGEFRYVTVTNDQSIYKYTEREIEHIDTDLTTLSDANILGERYMWIVNQPGRYVNFETHLRPLQANLGTKLFLTKTKSPNSVAGGMNQTLMEVIGVERDLAGGRTRIQCVDTRGLGLNVGMWMADEAPDWDTATEAEKSVSGFWTDDGGYVKPPDEGLNFSRWW